MKIYLMKRCGKDMKGIVSWYDKRKGYIYIVGKDGVDVLVYEKDMDFLALLHAGDKAEYEIEKTDQRPRVANIKKIATSIF